MHDVEEFDADYTPADAGMHWSDTPDDGEEFISESDEV